jgi:hypothetical protein
MRICGACHTSRTRIRREEESDDASYKHLQMIRLASVQQLRRSSCRRINIRVPELALVVAALAAFLMCLVGSGVNGQTGLPGTWEILLQNAGIASMHTAVTHYNTVVLLDRTDIGASQIPLASRYFVNPKAQIVLGWHEYLFRISGHFIDLSNEFFKSL